MEAETSRVVVVTEIEACGVVRESPRGDDAKRRAAERT